MNKKFLYVKASATTIILITIALSNGIFQSTTAQQQGSDEELVLNFFFEEPTITEVIVSGTTYHKITMDGLPARSENGTPILPVNMVKVLLPQRGVVDSIEISYEEDTSLGYGYNVLLGNGAESTKQQGGQGEWEYVQNYNPSVPYPTAIYNEVGDFDFRGYEIYAFNLNPVYYEGDTGEIYYYQEMTATISISYDGVISPLFRGLAVDRMIMEQMVDDSSFVSTYTINKIPYHSSLVNPDDSYKFVIITTALLQNKFDQLVQYKNNHGTSAKIVTLGSILSDPFYNFDPYYNIQVYDDQERIRNFIRDAYLNWETDYILLGGDKGVIPVRKVDAQIWPVKADIGYLPMPCDLYFACLDGTYDYDNDGQYGEMKRSSQPYGDGDGGGPVDLVAEVYVGRACVSNQGDADNFVSKTVAYENINHPYLQKVTLAGEWLAETDEGETTWGGDFLDVLIPYFNGYIIDTLYDRDWSGHDWPKQQLIDRINANTHILVHEGHSHFYINMKLYKLELDVQKLTNNKYCFIYSNGCFAGGFDNTIIWETPFGETNPLKNIYLDSIGEDFIKSAHCAFAGVWNAREGWFRPLNPDVLSSKFMRDFFEAVYIDSQSCYRFRELGVALQKSKLDNLGFAIDRPAYRWIYYEQNLFGDPQIILKPPIIPGHDIAVEYVDVCDYFIPNTNFDVDAVVFNQGDNTEYNIVVNFRVLDSSGQEVVTDSTTIVSLIRYGRERVSFSCSLPEGSYTIEIEVPSLPGETILDNNLVNKGIESDYPPATPSISGEQNGYVGEEYFYNVSTTDPDGDDVYYLFDWGDDVYEGWRGPHASGEVATYSHIWEDVGDFTIRVKAKNIYGVESDWATLPVSMPYVYLSGCTQGTHVSMAMGSGVIVKTIEMLQPGDMIQSFDTSHQQIVPARVVNIIEYSEDSPENYLVINNNLQVTQDHLLYLNRQDWGEAQYAHIGDFILANQPGTLDNNEQIITSIETVDCDRQIIIYDLVIEPLWGEACGYWANNILVSGVLE